MKAEHRFYKVSVSGHEKMLLALYRSMPNDRRRDVDSVLAAGWRLPEVAERFKAEGDELDVGALNAAHIEPFLEASHDIMGVERRAA